jgi:hypothetical protein
MGQSVLVYQSTARPLPAGRQLGKQVEPAHLSAKTDSPRTMLLKVAQICIFPLQFYAQLLFTIDVSQENAFQ